MPQGMSREREGLLQLYGASFEITESMGGMNEAVDAAQRIAAERGDVLHPRPVLQPGQPRDPPAHDSRGDLGRHRRGGRRVRRRGRDGRDDHRRGRGAQGAQPRLHVVAVEPRASAVLSGCAAGPAQDPGDRRGLRRRRAQPRRPRRGDPRGRRGRDRDGAPVRARGGRPRRHLVRGGALGRDRGRRAAEDAPASASWSCCRTPASATCRTPFFAPQ